MLCSGDMKGGGEKLHWFCLGSAWLFICLGEKQTSLPVAKYSNAEKWVSCGYSGDFGNNKHFSLRKISIDATHWNWANCFYFLFSLTINLHFLPFPAVAAFLVFSLVDGRNTCSLETRRRATYFFLGELLELKILTNPNWIMIFRRWFVREGFVGGEHSEWEQ